MPEWYPLIRASRYLGVPPWDLLERGAIWVSLALASEQAEVSARVGGMKKRGGDGD